ncbi:MAG: hypothetical protein RJB66_1678 [Pseudomonadota bacterium]|jgi:glycosyltransferase involved in cell wall biosynthesis
MTHFTQISYNGLSESGGVERVAFYVKESLEKCDVLSAQDFWLLRKLNGHFPRIYSRLGWILFSILTSCYCRWKGFRTISHGFQCAFIQNEIVFAHGTMAGFLEATEHLKKARLGFLYRYFERSAFSKAKKIIAVCERVKNELVQFYQIAPEKIFVVNNCVDTNRFQPGEPDSLNGRLRILFVGRLEAAKGLDALLKLASKLETQIKTETRSGFEMELRIISAGKQNVDLFKVFENTSVVSDLNLDDMPKEYQKADILIIPSLYEGFEMITLESLASGVPVIARPIGAAETLSNQKLGPYTKPWPIVLNDFTDIGTIVDLIGQIGQIQQQQKWLLHEQVDRLFSFRQFQQQILALIQD